MLNSATSMTRPLAGYVNHAWNGDRLEVENRGKCLCRTNRGSRSRARRRGSTLIVVNPEQPDLRDSAPRPARDIARIGIFADLARHVVPIGAVAHAPWLAGLVVAALGPALTALRPAPFRRGALDVRIPGLGIGAVG